MAQMSTRIALPDSAGLAGLCAADGEFALAARYWNGGLRIVVEPDEGDDRAPVQVSGYQVIDGRVALGHPEDGPGVITLTGPAALWERMLRPVPPRFFNDVSAAVGMGLERSGDMLAWWQYVPAVQRSVELMRSGSADGSAGDPMMAAASGAASTSVGSAPIDAPTGRYVHLELQGHDHRIYFEEAGRGIPLLLQHTAGSHGTQWRHLFECPAITDRFRLIAYDLPFHG